MKRERKVKEVLHSKVLKLAEAYMGWSDCRILRAKEWIERAHRRHVGLAGGARALR